MRTVRSVMWTALFAVRC